MKRLLLLIPITLLLWGCSNEWYYATTENMAKVASDLQSQIDELRWWQKVLDDKINLVDSQVESNFWMKETTKPEICLWLTDITVATYQAKDVFECIGDWEWYCSCIEKFASCWVQLSDIPKEYQNDFKPSCFNN